MTESPIVEEELPEGVELVLTSDALDSAELMLNGTELRDDVLPPLEPEQVGTRPADVPARGMAFIVYPNADAPACQ